MPSEGAFSLFRKLGFRVIFVTVQTAIEPCSLNLDGVKKKNYNKKIKSDFDSKSEQGFNYARMKFD